MNSQTSAICIIGDAQAGEGDPYKIIYTKSCASQIIKYYKTQGRAIKIHLYKYGTRTDADRIKELLSSKNIHANPANTYQTSLDTLLSVFTQYFEPDLDSDSDETKIESLIHG